MQGCEIVPVTINERWTLKLPAHRAARVEWPHWELARTAAVVERIEELTKKLGRRPVVFDVGAEEGDLPGLWSYVGADLCLFEPNQRVWPNIRAIFEANDLKRPLRCWVGFAGDVDDYDFDVPFASWPGCSYGDVIGDHGFCHLWERPDIAKVTIDTFVDGTGIAPDIINIDVEGSEGRVLAGAEKTLSEHRPTAFVSVHPTFMADMFAMYGDTPESLHEYMLGLGYEATHLETDHEEHWRFDP